MAAGRGEVRIIGGLWRSRRIRFPSARGLRPTPDRLRETLFDWLGPWVAGRRALDLYAGSGALGIEALSRGAAEAVFVERSRRVAAALKKNLTALETVAYEVVCADAPAYLRRCSRQFDLVFLDPPFDEGRVEPALGLLAGCALLATDHRVYVEQRRGTGPPSGWTVLNRAAAGEAQALLLRRNGSENGIRKQPS